MPPIETGTGRAAEAALPFLDPLLERLDTASRWLLVAVMSVLVTLVSLQVFFRYALADSIDFADEVSRLSFVWSIFLAIPHAVRRGLHVGIDLIPAKLPPRLLDRLTRASAAIGGALMVVVVWSGTRVAEQNWDQLMPTVDVTFSLFYLAVVVGGLHAGLHLLRIAWTGRALPLPLSEAS